jgi:dihydropteroate synthase
MQKLNLASRTIITEHPAFIMGIVNATPDSFWNESRGGADRALQLIDEGADLLDVGGESSRPGSAYLDAEEEKKRIIPVIREVRKHSNIPISVDTRKSEVMKTAYDAGADILNDISAFEDDAALAPFAAQTKIPVILMHKRGIPVIMQNNTEYADVFAEVSGYLEQRAVFAQQCGISADKIIVDPGIGFGKDLAGCITLIRNCGKLCGGRYPVLMALSRKTCIGGMTGRTVDKRLAGTLAADIIAVQNGASMIRVHDVAAAADTLAVIKMLGTEG